MYFPTDPTSEIPEVGGDPLEGSGFENEAPDPQFESDSHSAEEGLLR
jgi:hypothetical protein